MRSATAASFFDLSLGLASAPARPLTARIMVFPAAIPSDLPLNALVARVGQARDQEAFAALFDHFAPRLNAYMRKLGADAAQAEELVQETMLSVWDRASAFDPAKAGASTWIYTIARNKRIDAARRFRPEYTGDDLPDQAAPEPEQHPLEAAQAARSLELAIDELPADQADLLRLAYFDDLPHSEIASRRKLPLGTVKSRLRLALDKLRRALKETA